MLSFVISIVVFWGPSVAFPANSETMELTKDQPKELCHKIFIDREMVEIFEGLNPNEKKLICGEKGSSWEELPRQQSLYHLKTVLQGEGYYSPQVREHGEKLIVKRGKRTHVEKIDFRNAPSDFFDRDELAILESPLTSDTLNKIQAWSESRLRAIGFPCPEVEVLAGIEEASLCR